MSRLLKLIETSISAIALWAFGVMIAIQIAGYGATLDISWLVIAITLIAIGAVLFIPWEPRYLPFVVALIAWQAIVALAALQPASRNSIVAYCELHSVVRCIASTLWEWGRWLAVGYLPITALYLVDRLWQARRAAAEA